MRPERSLRREVARQREPLHRINPNFRTLQEIVFPDEVLDFRGESVLIHDTGSEDQYRMLIFSNEQLEAFSRTASIFQIDGTFSKAPKCYNDSANNHGQLYSIHALVNGISIPVYYALLKTKRQVDYSRLFTFLRD